jgi:hypothetical protein
MPCGGPQISLTPLHPEHFDPQPISLSQCVLYIVLGLVVLYVLFTPSNVSYCPPLDVIKEEVQDTISSGLTTITTAMKVETGPKGTLGKTVADSMNVHVLESREDVVAHWENMKAATVYAAHSDCVHCVNKCKKLVDEDSGETYVVDYKFTTIPECPIQYFPQECIYNEVTDKFEAV